jgi:hypothetical protein
LEIAVRSRAYTVILTAEVAALLISGAALAVEPQGANDPDDLFQRVRARMAEHFAQLPNYTCHETIERMLRAGADLRHLDTVELEVAFVGREELFSRTGEDKFGEQPIERLVSGGTIGNTALGSHLDAIFSKNVAEFKFAGECKKDGRRTLRFNLRVPLETSDFRVKHNGAAGMAGYEGSVWVDAETYDPVRVDFKVNRIPSHLGVRFIEESLHYRKLTIGNSDFDLPDRSELTATDDSGYSTVNMIKLTRCHEFGAESTVKYNVPSQGTASRDKQDH